MKTSSGHLTYCTNIHAGKDWAADFDNLKLYFPRIKAAMSPNAAMGIGLRISNNASLTLAEPSPLAAFKSWLETQDAYVFTMNGFPYGEFHHTVVKAEVHSPDWSTAARMEYTIRLARILAAVLPPGMEGGISTSPLSYRHWFDSPEALDKLLKAATVNILEVVKELIEVYQKTGKRIHLDLEPEPDGIIESGAEYMNWYEQQLLPMGIPFIANACNLDDEEAENMIKQHLCLCYDVCHFSIGFEDHGAVLEQLSAKGLKVGKIQISAALKGKFGNVEGDQEVLDDFQRFNEPTYLHQVVARDEKGTLLRYPDLDEALKDFQQQSAEEWRAHFHVPISIDRIGNLQSTQKDILEVLDIQKKHPFTSHLEVETYTWEVLPEGLKIPVADSIIKELNWVIKHAIK